MKKSTLLMLLLFAFASNSYAQCIQTQISPSNTLLSNNLGLPQTMSTCVMTKFYSSYAGLIVGSDYIFTCISNTPEAVHKYITITDGSNNILAHGPSPLTVNDITLGQIKVHFSENIDCDLQSVCVTSKLQLILTCPIPVNLEANDITTTAADFAWEPAGSETNWEVIVQPAGTAAPTSSTAGTAVADNPVYTNSNLSPGTLYSFYVRANCGSEFSPWSPVKSFQTPCLPVTDFIEKFDASTVFPICWSKLIRGSNVSSANVSININSTLSSAPNLMTIGNGTNTNTSDDVILISPPLVGIEGTGHRLKFFARGSGTDTAVQVGTITGSDIDAAFTPVSNHVLGITANEYTIDFSNYVGTNTQIAFRINAPNYNTVFLDDIRWETAPSCADVTQVKVEVVTEATATISWTAPTGQTVWEVAYGTQTETDASLQTIVTADATTKILGGLAESTAYNVWVRSVCAENGYWIGPIKIKTDCAAVANFSEDFDSVTYPALPGCWRAVKRGPTLSTVAKVETTNYTQVQSAPNSVWFADVLATQSMNNYVMLVSPNLSTAGTGTHRLRFNTKNEGIFQIGTVSSNTNSGVFTMVQDVVMVNGPTMEHIVEFENHISTDRYIAIRLVGGINAYVDNVVWEPIPTCPDVNGIVINGVDTDEVTVSWTAAATETNWDIAVGATTITDASTLPFVSSTSTTKEITGLTTATNYKVWVRSSCSDTEKGAWRGPVSFRTDCEPIADFNENFDGVTAPVVPNCWRALRTGPQINEFVNLRTDMYTTVFSAPNSLYMSNALANNANNKIILISPNLSNAAAGTHQLKFYAKNAAILEVGTLSSNTDSGTFHPIQTITTTTAVAQYTVDFSSALETGDRYVGIRLASTSSYSTVYIDNIVWEQSLGTVDFTNNKWSYYPNPVKNVLTINNTQAITSVSIFNMLGQKVQEVMVNANDAKIDMSNLSSGNYIARVVANDQIKTIKVIKE